MADDASRSSAGLEIAQAYGAPATAEVLPVPEAEDSGEEIAEAPASEPPPASEKRIATVRPLIEDEPTEDTLIDAKPPMVEASRASEEVEEERTQITRETAVGVSASSLLAGLPASFDPNAPIAKSTLIMGSSFAPAHEKPSDQVAIAAKHESVEEKTEIEERTEIEGLAKVDLSLESPLESPKKKADATLLSAGVDPDAPVSKDTTPGIGKVPADLPKVEAKTEPKDEAPVGTKTLVMETRPAPPNAPNVPNVMAKKASAPSIEPTPTPSGVVLPLDASDSMDDLSVPPIVNEPSLERFFSEGDVARHAADEVTEEVVPEKLKQKLAPHVVQRRARFSRYVTWAVGISAVVCLAAVARTALSPKAAAPTRAAAHVVAEPPEPPAAVAPPPVVVTPPKEEPKPEAVAVNEPPKVEAKEGAAAAAPAGTDAPKAEGAAPAADPRASERVPPSADPRASERVPPSADPRASERVPPSADPPAGDAKEEKKNCKKALERGKMKDAIDAGEKSVAIDPTDGEAWLLLGAAYQESGKLAEARRCYAACLKEGKTGPRNECAKMLR